MAHVEYWCVCICVLYDCFTVQIADVSIQPTQNKPMLQQEQVLIQNHEMGGHSDILYWRIKSLGLCVRVHPNNYAHQLYGLTLLVGPCSPQLVEIYVNVNIRPLAMFERTLATPWQSIMADHHFCQFCSAPFLGSADFPNCTKDNLAPLCWSHSVVSCRCMQIAILIQSGFMAYVEDNHIKRWPWSST